MACDHKGALLVFDTIPPQYTCVACGESCAGSYCPACGDELPPFDGGLLCTTCRMAVAVATDEPS